jgi:hypothetical protein
LRLLQDQTIYLKDYWSGTKSKDELLFVAPTSDLVASVPLAIAEYFARLGVVEVLALPVTPTVFDVQQYWHRRANQDAGHKWIREQMLSLFNSVSDPWLHTERSLYGQIRGRR